MTTRNTFVCSDVEFETCWIPGAEHYNGGHYAGISSCGRIVCRRTEGERYYEVAVDGRRYQSRLASMKAAMHAGALRLAQLKEAAS